MRARSWLLLLISFIIAVACAKSDTTVLYGETALLTPSRYVTVYDYKVFDTTGHALVALTNATGYFAANGGTHGEPYQIWADSWQITPTRQGYAYADFADCSKNNGWHAGFFWYCSQTTGWATTSEALFLDAYYVQGTNGVLQLYDTDEYVMHSLTPMSPTALARAQGSQEPVPRPIIPPRPGLPDPRYLQ